MGVRPVFVQVIRARTNDAEGVMRQGQRWDSEIRPDVKGFLGSTSGVTDDGRQIAVVRFASREDAERNSGSDRQSAWWNEMAKYLQDVQFTDCTEVDSILGGGSDEAGFVQVIAGRATDTERVRALTASMEEALRANRPEILGVTTAWSGDRFVETVYFADEQSARAAEAREPDVSHEVRAQLDEWQSLITDTEYYDLRPPNLRLAS